MYLGGRDAVFAPLPLEIMWGYGHWEKGQTPTYLAGLLRDKPPTYLAGLLSTRLGFGTLGSITSLAFPTRNAKIDVKYSNRNLTGRHKKQIMPVS